MSALPFQRVYPARTGGVGHGVNPRTGRLLCGGNFAFSPDFETPMLMMQDCAKCVRTAKKLMLMEKKEVA
jgi:hypothetical protein